MVFSGYLPYTISGGSVGKESACNEEDLGLIPGWGRSPGERNGNPLSCLGNPIDRGAWRATVHEVTKSQSQLSDLNFHFHTFYYIICWEEN